LLTKSVLRSAICLLAASCLLLLAFLFVEIQPSTPGMLTDSSALSPPFLSALRARVPTMMTPRGGGTAAAAAAAATGMEHVPKRATQHGLFVSNAETEPTALKPGQFELHRRGLYTLEAKASLAETAYIDSELPARSEYQAASSKVRPGHYTHREPLARPGPCQQGQGAADLVRSGAAHWQSEYKTAGREAGEAPHEHRAAARGQIRPWPIHPLSVVGCGEDSTAYRDHFGRFGSNPRDRIRMDDTKLPVFKTPLNAGTPRGTAHIPNYQGYIPSKLAGPESERAASGEGVRSIDKTNMVDIFQRNLVGYAGHVPRSFRNDFGGRKQTNLTVHGSDYGVPNLRATSVGASPRA